MGLSSPPPPKPGFTPLYTECDSSVCVMLYPIPLTEETCKSKTHNQMIIIRSNESNFIYRYCYAN